MASPNSDLPTFASFVSAGFECTYAETEPGIRLDMLTFSRHDVLCRDDYHLLKEQGIKTVREGLAWSQIDQGKGVYDFSRFEAMMQIGQEEGIQQIWDLNHFDYPSRLDPFSDEFVDTFAHYAQQAILTIKKYISRPIYIVPVNEISFFAWIGADMGWWAPFRKGQTNGYRFKAQLVKAAISAMDAIWEVDPMVRFIQVDPFMRRLAKEPAKQPARNHVDEFNNIVRFEAWDMLAGEAHPELGGSAKYLDIIGVNYYIHNQEWVLSNPQSDAIAHQLMDWQSQDRVSFAQMLKTIHDRYKRPMMISETGSYGLHREEWWKRTFKEIDEGLSQGLPITGVCMYPTVDRPETVNYLIPNSGLWDFDPTDKECQRIPHQPSLDVIRNYISSVAK